MRRGGGVVAGVLVLSLLASSPAAAAPRPTGLIKYALKEAAKTPLGKRVFGPWGKPVKGQPRSALDWAKALDAARRAGRAEFAALLAAALAEGALVWAQR